MTDSPDGTTDEPREDPDTDARRGEPLVTDVKGRRRIWATGWYRVRPRTFVHQELFFDPDRVTCMYAEESYKSCLLRRSGREREAARVGRKHLLRPQDELTGHSRTFTVSIDAIDEVRLRAGSLLFKPKLAIVTDEKTYNFHHWRRSQDTNALATVLRANYSFDVTEK